MSNVPENPEWPQIYEVRVKGHLEEDWGDWFGGVTVTLQDDGITLLTCRVRDQAALFSLLRRIRDLGLPLLSVKSSET
jgi:hypothetical protein